MRNKIVAVFVSAKIHFLGTNPPTQIQEVRQRHLSKTNSHLHQMQATKTISPRRQESRNSAAPNERQQDIQQPKTLVFGDKPTSSWPEKGIQKTSRNMAAIKGPRLYLEILQVQAKCCVPTVRLRDNTIRQHPFIRVLSPRIDSARLLEPAGFIQDSKFRATVTLEVSLVPPLRIAVLHRHRGNVQLLLNARADPWQAVSIVSLCDHPCIGLTSCRDVNLSMSCKYPLHRAQRIRWLTYSLNPTLLP